MFSISLGGGAYEKSDNEQANSFIQFGSYNESLINSTNYNFIWLYLRSANVIWWEVAFTKARYGTSEIDLSV